MSPLLFYVNHVAGVNLSAPISNIHRRQHLQSPVYIVFLYLENSYSLVTDSDDDRGAKHYFQSS